MTGLEPTTVLSQWYPHRGLYGSDVEGMHLLLEVPSIPSNQLKLPPKSLVPGCVKIFTDLRSDINKHYNIDSVQVLTKCNWLTSLLNTIMQY